MLKTKFPYETIDFDRYYNAYMEREDAIRAFPKEEELEELARRVLVKDHLVLASVPEGDMAQLGDTVTFRTESEFPKYNKERVTVSIGRGLYHKELERLAAGKKAGDTYQLMIEEKPVTVTILEVRRKQEPEELTDEMAAELQMKDDQGNPITTVEKYMEYMKYQKRMECLANVNYYVMEKLLSDYPVPDCNPEDLDRLAELEREFFARIYREQEGIDVNALTKEQANEMWGDQCDSFDGFIRLRYEWYRMKIQQCLVYRSILGLGEDPAYDCTDHYEVLSELQEKMFALLETRLTKK